GILHDQKCRLAVSDVIVAAYARTIADRNAREQIGRVIEGLVQLQDVALTSQRDSEPFAHGARAAVASDDVLRARLRGATIRHSQSDGDAVGILAQGHELVTVTNVDGRERLSDTF